MPTSRAVLLSDLPLNSKYHLINSETILTKTSDQVICDRLVFPIEEPAKPSIIIVEITLSDRTEWLVIRLTEGKWYLTPKEVLPTGPLEERIFDTLEDVIKHLGA